MTNKLINKLNELELNPNVFIIHDFGTYFVFDIRLLNQSVIINEPFYYCKEAFDQNGDSVIKET